MWCAMLIARYQFTTRKTGTTRRMLVMRQRSTKRNILDIWSGGLATSSTACYTRCRRAPTRTNARRLRMGDLARDVPAAGRIRAEMRLHSALVPATVTRPLGRRRASPRRRAPPGRRRLRPCPPAVAKNSRHLPVPVSKLGLGSGLGLGLGLGSGSGSGLGLPVPVSKLVKAAVPLPATPIQARGGPQEPGARCEPAAPVLP